MEKNNKLEQTIFASFPLDASRPVSITDTGNGNNIVTMERLNEVLHAVGVSLIPKDDQLILMVDAMSYNKEKTRHAGNRRKYSYESDESIDFIKYYDIMYWKYGLGLKWKEIIRRTGLSRATFFRHKKEMEESSYYKNFVKEFDPTTEHDLEYFKGIRELDQSF